jgi:hypothetical protein
MAFIHQHQIVALERIHRDGFVAAVFRQLGDFQNFHRMAGEQAGAFLGKNFRLDAAFLELLPVLV